MKKVLVHVGYPKAASTTLQNGLFLQLHRKGLINFLGRAFESGYYGALRNKGEFKGWFKSVIAGSDRLDTPAPLSDTLLNVLSEGLFMMNERHSNDLVTPGQLRSYFSSRADKVNAVLVIRAQSTLLPSYFVQNYRRFKQSTFDDFLNLNISRKWKGEGIIFDLNQVVRAYAQTLGRENVHVLFFEDFVQDRLHFSAELGRIMGQPSEIILQNLGEAHMNPTRKEQDAIVIRKLDKRSVRYYAVKLLGLLNWGEFLKIRIPPISEQQRQRIFDTFRGSNEQLATEFGLDRERMQRYRYF